MMHFFTDSNLVFLVFGIGGLGLLALLENWGAQSDEAASAEAMIAIPVKERDSLQ